MHTSTHKRTHVHTHARARYYRFRGAHGFAQWINDARYSAVAFAPSEFYTAPYDNSSGYDSFALFGEALSPATTVLVGSNVVAVPGSVMDGVFDPHRVVVVNGIKVGIISLVADDIVERTDGENELEMVGTPWSSGESHLGCSTEDRVVLGARRAVHALRTAHPDVVLVVAMSTMTHEEDVRVATSAGIDVVLGRQAEGAPTSVVLADVVTNRTTVVTRLAERFGSAVGNLGLTVDRPTGAIGNHTLTFETVDPSALVRGPVPVCLTSV